MVFEFNTVAEANREIVRLYSDRKWVEEYGGKFELEVLETTNRKYAIHWVPIRPLDMNDSDNFSFLV